MPHILRTVDEMESIVKLYSNLLYRICFIQLGNDADVEDIIQETMIAYLQKAPAFQSREHEKAWLITVATNKCRDIQRYRSRHPHTDMENLQYTDASCADTGILEALMTVPEKFRLVLTLHYVENYKVSEIARMIGVSQSAVKMRLMKGRKLLKAAYEKES